MSLNNQNMTREEAIEQFQHMTKKDMIPLAVSCGVAKHKTAARAMTVKVLRRAMIDWSEENLPSVNPPEESIHHDRSDGSVEYQVRDTYRVGRLGSGYDPNLRPLIRVRDGKIVGEVPSVEGPALVGELTTEECLERGWGDYAVLGVPKSIHQDDSPGAEVIVREQRYVVPPLPPTTGAGIKRAARTMKTKESRKRNRRKHRARLGRRRTGSVRSRS